MSETFSPFVPSAGTGPDASIGEPRIISLVNARLEADGRVVASNGFEEVELSAVRAASIKAAADDLILCGSASGLALSLVDAATDVEVRKVSPLVPMGFEVLANHQTRIYQETMGLTEAGGVLIAYQKLDIGDPGTEGATYTDSEAGDVYWIELDADGEQVAQGELSGVANHTHISSYVVGSYLVLWSATDTATSGVENVYHLVDHEMVLLGTREDCPETAGRYILYAYDDGTSICYGFEDHQYNCNKTTGAITEGTLRVIRPTYVWNRPEHRRLPYLCEIDGSTAHVCRDTYTDNNHFRIYTSNNDTYYRTDEANAFWTSPDPFLAGIWPSDRPSGRGVWAPGLRYVLANTSSQVECGWTNTNADNDDLDDYIAYYPNKYTEFPGPYLDLGALGCITFGGNAEEFGGSFEGGSYRELKSPGKGVWLIEPPNSASIGSSSSSLRLIGEVSLDRFLGFVALTTNNVLILLGRKIMQLGSFTLAVEKWKVAFDDEPLEGTVRHSIGRSLSGHVVSGGAPVEISNGFSSPWLRWVPSYPPEAPTDGDLGTFLLCCHWSTIDDNGNYIDGPVSATATCNKNGDATVYACPDIGDTQRLYLKVYATEDMGTTFYRVATIPYSDFVDGKYTVAMEVTDTTAEILYTQGETGALSGRFETSSVPPHRFYHICSTRCIVGGLARKNTVQLSDLYVYGEITPWPTGAQWVVEFSSEVTGVGELDGVPVVFCLDGIYAIGGMGPDAMGSGEFDSIQKLSVIGCPAPGSIVQVPFGWIFQAKDGQLYALRSGGQTECVSLSARSQVSGGSDTTYFSPSASVTASIYDGKENVATFSITDPNAPVEQFAVVLDLRNMQYSVDHAGANAAPSFNCPVLDPLWSNNGVMHCRSFTTSGTTDSYSVIAKRSRSSSGWWLGFTDALDDSDTSLWRKPSFATSNLTPWGKPGWGRVREVTLAVTQDSVSRAAGEPYSVLISVATDGDTLSEARLESTLLDSVIDFVPEHQKCSDFRLSLEDRSSPPLIWHGVSLSTTDAKRTRVR